MQDVKAAIQRARDHLFSLQHPDGWWCGELEADAMLEADYIFLHVLLGTGDAGKMRRAMTEILRYQNDDGSWSLYPGGPGNISLTVKCYFAGKLMGMSPDDPVLAPAREWILAHGGAQERQLPVDALHRGAGHRRRRVEAQVEGKDGVPLLDADRTDRFRLHNASTLPEVSPVAKGPPAQMPSPALTAMAKP